MSHSQPPPPSGNPQPDGSSDLTGDQLAAQARAAAEQALQLARLAEESARLARHLNEQVLARSGGAVPPRTSVSNESISTHSSSAEGPSELLPLISITEPNSSLLTRRRRKRRISRHQQILRQRVTRPEEMPRQVTIDTNRSEPQQPASPIVEITRNWKSWMLSTSVHVLVLVVLGLLTFLVEPARPIDTILASFVEADRTLEEAVPIEEPIEEEGEQHEDPDPEDRPPEEPKQQQQDAVAEELAPAPMPPKAMQAPQNLAGADEKPAAAEPGVDLAEVGSRSEAGKVFLLQKYGGTAASESAVDRALDWFVSVQRRDGSWNFNDVGRASHAGTANNPMGATSYVLLAFLGSGQTHFQGQYKQSIGQGLRFLLQNARPVPAGADFRGPNVEENHNFYVQGAAAMALCEAYGMTKDRNLRKAAQGAIQFIVAAQDPTDGGWRYAPREPGCTSVTTLQLTALISARRCGFTVPPRVLDGVRHYYTTVKCDQEPTGRYSYRAEGLSYKSSSTAQAALGRMYLGAPRDDADLQAAIALLDERGPYENRYYCYYATQVLKNWGGPEWERWNASLREELIRTQDAGDGPARGSWAPLQRGPTDVSGGRLFTTALSTMTLEVYYRYLPIYDLDDDAKQAGNNAAEMAVDTPHSDTKTVP